ncbi:MAG TPA: class I SAM-dependent methyltransferase [Thermomicrobiales bacterium]|nr:class I SAM-dependent methyltransferase [Thermomicrobiales bacterium]
MDCCRAQTLDAEFGEKIAAINLREYRRRGPSKTTRLLLEALRAEGVAGRTLLDIGGGVGAISHELFRSDLAHATSVDAAGAFIDAARTEAERQGHANRMSLYQGDFVMLAADIPTADIVTLDRVICCYPDMPALVDSSVAHAKTVYGLVYPRDTWVTRHGVRLLNWYFRVRRHSFRTFIHSTESVSAHVVAQGFQVRFQQLTGLWRVVVYARA